MRRVDVFGVDVSVVDYPSAVEAIMTAAQSRQSFGMTALAVHGLMLASDDPVLCEKINGLDLVTPDGQPVRWVMNMLHDVGLRRAVTGPDLTGEVCAAAAEHDVGVYLYGSTPETCERFVTSMRRRHPRLRFVGVQPDRFRDATDEEDRDDVARINGSGAGVVLVGRGCPRQEHWVADHQGRVHAAMLAVGAAFDFHAGTLRRAPGWMRRAGLEWLWRVALEPRRLWRRYAVMNTRYAVRLAGAFARRATAQSGR